MAKEAKFLNKNLYKLELYSAKVVPMLMAGITLANTILSYLGIQLICLSYIGGISLLVLIRFYITSYTYRFCSYHRMFLHYIFISNSLALYDYHVGIPLDDTNLFALNMIIAGIALFIILYLKFKVCPPLKE
jgi:hypothetical protein